MLSENQKTAFRLQQFGYKYMPSHPITWDSEYKQLKNNSMSKYSINCFLISLFLNGLHSFAAAYAVFTQFFVNERKNYHAGSIGMDILAGFLTALTVAIAFTFSKNPECLLGINALFQINPTSKLGKLSFLVYTHIIRCYLDVNIIFFKLCFSENWIKVNWNGRLYSVRLGYTNSSTSNSNYSF